MTQDIKKNKTMDAPVKKKRSSASLDVRKSRAGWGFIMPFILGFFLVYLPIIYDSIKYSFHHIKILTGGGYELIWVGFDNYSEALFVNPDFVQTLTTGIQQLIFDIPAIVIFSLFMAVLLNQKMAGRTFFRAVFFIPVILSTGLIADIDNGNQLIEYMGSEEGIDDGSGSNQVTEIVSVMDVEQLFDNMKVGTEIVEYVVQMVNNIFNIVNRSGVQMLIFLAGLQAISPDIYEACSIDGATGWETFWKITFPMISPMILVNAIYTVIDSFTASTNTVMSFITSTYNDAADGTVIASAMSWMYFLIVILIIAVVAAIMSAYVFYQRRD